MKNYKIADKSDTVTIINSLVSIQPEEYLIISKDSTIDKLYEIPCKVIISSFPILNNTNDKVILLDSLNRTIDSLFYNSDWGGTSGKSLERLNVNISSLDSTNWETCSLYTWGNTWNYKFNISKGF